MLREYLCCGTTFALPAVRPLLLLLLLLVLLLFRGCVGLRLLLPLRASERHRAVLKRSCWCRWLELFAAPGSDGAGGSGGGGGGGLRVAVLAVQVAVLYS